MRILVADDQSIARRFYQVCMEPLYTVDLAANGPEALKIATSTHHDLYIVDLMMPGMSGIELIRRLREIQPDPPVIIISQTDDIDLALEALREQPFEFLRKPVSKSLLLHTIGRCIASREIRQRLTRANDQTALDARCPEPVLGDSSTMSAFWNRLRDVAQSELNVAVLITGESGTGKEVAARHLHRCFRGRSGPFIAMNCGLMRPDLAPSEIFGIEKGVATGVSARTGRFQIADQGTLFLDEVAELPADVQPALLRVLQDKTVTPVGGKTGIQVDVRVIAATNKNLGEQVEKGRFREDLYFRLSVVQLHIPPLRNRKDEIPLLLDHLYRRHGGQGDVPLTKNEMRAFIAYEWPGNIRELETALLNRMITGGPVDPAASGIRHSRTANGELLERWMQNRPWQDLKTEIYAHVLKTCNGNTRLAAGRLRISHTSMWEFARKHGLK
ncbi:sigma-54-dependent Fis family transcriptional regulator [bacterium]|nr:sigma-54-dependent Fis family transcriptional regulator [candidate division CSSED10-310 bacterium]